MKTLNPKDTAILFFAHTSEEEVKHKNIENGHFLFQTLTNKTLQTIKRTGLPYFHFTEKDQKGTSFGERFTNAIEYVFTMGFEKVITIGNDSPLLKTKHLLKASKNISANKSVLGASTDGGFYLMGFHKTQFKAQDFVGMPWKTSQLQKQVYTWAINNALDICRLTVLRDIDTVKDVSTISALYAIKNTRIKKVLLKILDRLKRTVTPYTLLKISTRSLEIVCNKGSPTSLFS